MTLYIKVSIEKQPFRFCQIKLFTYGAEFCRIGVVLGSLHKTTYDCRGFSYSGEYFQSDTQLASPATLRKRFVGLRSNNGRDTSARSIFDVGRAEDDESGL